MGNCVILAYFSVTADGVVLGDESTVLNQGEATLLDPLGGTYQLLHEEGENGASFGGTAFFESLGNPAGVGEDVDALFLHPDGRISFSTTSDFQSTLLGTVKDGSVATFDPSLPLTDPDSLTLLLDEEIIFPNLPGGANNNQDIDALHLDDEGRIYFSTAEDALLNGIGVEPLSILDGDVVRFDPSSGTAEVFLDEEDLAVGDADIDGFSFAPDGDPAFSVRMTTVLTGSDDKLVDGAIGRLDLASQTTGTLLYQSALFGSGQGAQADLNAIHLEAHPNPPQPGAPSAQIAFRNRIRVEGDPENTPNKDLTALGYLWMENNGPMTLLANYYASFGNRGPETFGSDTLLDHQGGGTAGWRFFSKDLAMPADDLETAQPEADSARALRLFLYHEKPETGSGLVGLDELAVVSWEVDAEGAPIQHDLNGLRTFDQTHNEDFLRIEGPAGFYQLKVKFRRLVTAP